MLKAFIEEASPQIESTLSTLIPSRPDLAYGSLSDSMRYSLLSGGKRLRPLMLLAAATTYGMDLRAALIPACALEIVHTYSLIHDDLPCMDDDDLRRGKPSLHKVVPEWEALLAGDALLTSAFEILSSLTHLEDTDALALIRVLSRAAGPNGMIGGQVLDLLAGSSDWPRVVSMHEKKTGALSLLLCNAAVSSQRPPSPIKTNSTKQASKLAWPFNLSTISSMRQDAQKIWANLPGPIASRKKQPL